jgi:hypothetical protein
VVTSNIEKCATGLALPVLLVFESGGHYHSCGGVAPNMAGL